MFDPPSTDKQLCDMLLDTLLNVPGLSDTQFTCERCNKIRSCSLAFDCYNTDGDCLLEK